MFAYFIQVDYNYASQSGISLTLYQKLQTGSQFIRAAAIIQNRSVNISVSGETWQCACIGSASRFIIVSTHEWENFS